MVRNLRTAEREHLEGAEFNGRCYAERYGVGVYSTACLPVGRKLLDEDVSDDKTSGDIAEQ